MFESTGDLDAAKSRRAAEAAPSSGSPATSWAAYPPSGALLNALAELSPASLDAEQAIEASVALGRVIAAAQAAQLRLLARFARLRPPTPGAGRSFSEFAADEIAPALRISRHAAAAQLALAVQLASSLPRTLAAMARGDIDLSRARVLCDVTSGVSAAHASQVEERVLDRARIQTASQLRQSARRAVLSVDPDGAERRHNEARLQRSVRLLPCENGMAELRAYLPAAHATAILRRIDAISLQSRVSGDARTADQRRTDTFTDLLLGARPSDVAGRIATQVQVTVAASTLRGADQRPGELAGYGPIPAGLARELATAGDVTWRRLVTDPVTGSLLDYGRTTYRPPAALADHVRARDATCRFPGCRHPARGCDLDHSVPYPVGPTSASNLGALCRHHHRLKHETQWTVRQHDGDTFTWVSPTGRKYQTTPEPLAPPTVNSAEAVESVMALAHHVGWPPSRQHDGGSKDAVLATGGERPPC
jgi:hypothetical protein